MGMRGAVTGSICKRRERNGVHAWRYRWQNPECLRQRQCSRVTGITWLGCRDRAHRWQRWRRRCCFYSVGKHDDIRGLDGADRLRGRRIRDRIGRSWRCRGGRSQQGRRIGNRRIRQLRERDHIGLAEHVETLRDRRRITVRARGTSGSGNGASALPDQHQDRACTGCDRADRRRIRRERHRLA